jgi:hypothetical protein
MDPSRAVDGNLLTQSSLLSTGAGSLQNYMRTMSEQQLIHAALRDRLAIPSFRTIERDVEPCLYRANIGAASPPFVLPRPDKELDSCFLNVDPYFNCLMQIEDWKNVVDSVVFAGNAKHGRGLHGFALSTETGW